MLQHPQLGVLVSRDVEDWMMEFGRGFVWELFVRPCGWPGALAEHASQHLCLRSCRVSRSSLSGGAQEGIKDI